MVIKKPSIFIYTCHPDQDFLREICAGIEEEGVYSEIFSFDNDDLDTLTFEACADSMLGSGIGIVGVSAARQMKNVKKSHNVEQYYMPTYEECRKLGANSARAIKKLPFR